ncbi:MAG: hypothetical protein HGB08_01560 [Candidatus Moranbacteria bacterium]|nr:hypothetical protein [Candidatus Moranbacteria bacterium]
MDRQELEQMLAKGNGCQPMSLAHHNYDADKITEVKVVSLTCSGYEKELKEAIVGGWKLMSLLVTNTAIFQGAPEHRITAVLVKLQEEQ